MVTSVVLYLDYVICFFLPFMLFSQALLHLLLMHHMAQIMSYCRTQELFFVFFFLMLMQRKLNRIHMLKWNPAL